MRTRTLLAICALALPAPLLIAACGGDDEAAERDPRQVLEAIFENDEQIDSAVLDLTASGNAEGDQGGDFSLTLSGPFQGSGDAGSLPQLDLSVELTGTGGGQDIDFSGGLVLTENDAFVELDGNAYGAGPEIFAQLEQGFRQASQEVGDEDDEQQNLFEQLGIEPQSWLTDVENEGTTDVEGTDTVHISGEADVERIVEDINQIAEQTQLGDIGIPSDEVEQAADYVEDARIDVYGGVDDDLLRRLDASLTITPPEDSGDVGVDTVDINFSLTLSEVNEEQTIEAPEDAQPLAGLLGQLAELGLLEGFGDAFQGGGGAGGPGAGGGQEGGGGQPQGGQAMDDEYLECIAGAQTPEEINECLQAAS